MHPPRLRRPGGCWRRPPLDERRVHRRRQIVREALGVGVIGTSGARYGVHPQGMCVLQGRAGWSPSHSASSSAACPPGLESRPEAAAGACRVCGRRDTALIRGTLRPWSAKERDSPSSSRPPAGEVNDGAQRPEGGPATV